MRDLGLSGQQAGLVVVSTAGIYVSFVVLIRLTGQRALTSRSSFDFAAVIALGAVAGRVILGYTPTLLAGVIGLTSLLALQAGFGILRRFAWVDNAMSNRPLLLMADGRLLPENLRKAHLIEDELRPAAAGRHSPLQRRRLRHPRADRRDQRARRGYGHRARTAR